MRFGFFDQLPCPPGYSEQQRYQDILAQIELGDAVGFDTVWLGELHFSRGFSILADPLMVLAAAGQRTSRIRLGTAVTLLPMHNPVKIAEEAAIADILSNGRLEFGVGRDGLGGAPADTALAFPVHVSASRDQARAECEPGLMRFMREAGERLRPLGDHDVKSFEAFRQVLARMDRVTFSDIDREMGVFGDPDYCAERVRELRRDYGMDEFICYFNQGGLMDPAMVRRTMTLFAKEVMPHCR